eukprot:TRINITY_DN29198_c0_g1_i2.p1 TRINITY_DN29198_c0_g1~~TRINITY_DN29198_c0_g1_i2.p1  ORF type:complete len:470 (+),score=131.49 TRINITY_DN29198_c0_g1_i2:70-1479(+)
MSCAGTASWMGWALGVLPRAVQGYAERQHRIQQQDPLADLAAAACRLGPIEGAAAQLCSDCDRLLAHGASRPAEELLAAKCALLGRWERLEDALLSSGSELRALAARCCSAAGAEHDAEALCAGQLRRVDAALDSGAAAVARLGALRWAVPGEAGRRAAAAAQGGGSDAVCLCERDETQCRIEYIQAEARERRRAAGALDELAARVRELHPDRVRPPAQGGARAGGLAPPLHWSAGAREAAALPTPGGWSIVPAAHIAGSAEALLAATAAGKGFTVLRCDSIESPALWQSFAARRELVAARRSELAACPALVVETELRGRGHDILWDARENMRVDLNERWLLAGVHTDQLPTVAAEGLQGVCKRKGLYGAAVYFAETVARADESAAGAQPALLLCRVVLGRWRPALGPADAKGDAEGRFDSVVTTARSQHPALRPPADPAAWAPQHRDFVLYDAALAYPQYVVRYARGK